MERCALLIYLFVMVQSLSALEIVAHRGSSFDFPENTLLAAEQAWKENADIVECDVYLTRDNRIIVMHDEDTKRTTGTPGLIAGTDLADLQKLDAGLWKGASFKGTKIPTLEEFLATGPPHRRFFVEIKAGPGILPELKAVLQRSGLPPSQVVLISFQLPVLAAAKRDLPAYQCLWVLSYGRKSPPLDEVIDRARQAGMDGLDLSWKWPINRAFVQKVKAAGLQLHVWTVDDLTIARRLAEAGVDGIATNRPGYLREGLGR